MSTPCVSASRGVDRLIGQFGPVGQADLIRDYCAPLPQRVFIALAGFPASYEEVVLAATFGAMNASGSESAGRSEPILAHLRELVAQKRTKPGTDLTS